MLRFEAMKKGNNGLCGWLLAMKNAMAEKEGNKEKLIMGRAFCAVIATFTHYLRFSVLWTSHVCQI